MNCLFTLLVFVLILLIITIFLISRKKMRNNVMMALQDDCWDKICPSYDKDTKLACFEERRDIICGCCKKRGLPDCKVLIPGRGLVNACSL